MLWVALTCKQVDGSSVSEHSIKNIGSVFIMQNTKFNLGLRWNSRLLRLNVNRSYLLCISLEVLKQLRLL